ncbi:MAG: TIGR02266 family protein [Desulfatiglans sp.]|jgi:uncharacterized protein (TIGR02266 family)|nr:TIGR02266 family protein [Thermodesulfobacteriota bacterium]MEE4352731.1 TIGR02266 family protein [Desulfatiglans sp.]
MAAKLVYNIAEEETYHDGHMIFREGNSGDWIYVVLSGSVEVFKESNGQKHILEILQTGDLLGVIEFFTGSKRIASARAIGETTMGIIDRDFLEKEYNQLSGQFRSIVQTITLRYKGQIERRYGLTRRNDPRYSRSLSLSFRDRQSFIRAYTGNISGGGLFIKTEQPLDEGCQFRLKLQLPGVSDPLRILSEVVWNRKPKGGQEDMLAGMGVKFCEISAADRRLLLQYLGAGDQEE